MKDNSGCLIPYFFYLFCWVAGLIGGIQQGEPFLIIICVVFILIPSKIVLGIIRDDAKEEKRKEKEKQLFMSRVQALRNKPLKSLARDELQILTSAMDSDKEREDFLVRAVLAGNEDAKGALVAQAEKVAEFLGYQETIAHSDKITAIVPNGMSFYRKAYILEYLGDNEGALESFKKALEFKGFVGIPEAKLGTDKCEQAEKSIAKLQKIVNCEHIERDGRYDLIKTGVEYERFVCGVIKRAGYKCSMTPPTDQGVDIVVSLNDMKIAVQCKFLSQPVSNSAVQEVVAGKALYKCKYACVVSKSGYTQSARKLAIANKVKLLCHDDLPRYLDEVNSLEMPS